MFVKAVAVVDNLQIELKFAVIRDGAIRLYKRALVVIKALPKRCQVLEGMVPLCLVCFLEFHFCLHVEGAPAIVEGRG